MGEYLVVCGVVVEDLLVVVDCGVVLCLPEHDVCHDHRSLLIPTLNPHQKHALVLSRVVLLILKPELGKVKESSYAGLIMLHCVLKGLLGVGFLTGLA